MLHMTSKKSPYSSTTHLNIITTFSYFLQEPGGVQSKIALEPFAVGQKQDFLAMNSTEKEKEKKTT